MENIEKKKRGFALLSPEQLKEISRKGGRTAHELGVGHQFTVEEARIAGRKGGKAIHRQRKNEEPST